MSTYSIGLRFIKCIVHTLHIKNISVPIGNFSLNCIMICCFLLQRLIYMAHCIVVEGEGAPAVVCTRIKILGSGSAQAKQGFHLCGMSDLV